MRKLILLLILVSLLHDGLCSKEKERVQKFSEYLKQLETVLQLIQEGDVTKVKISKSEIQTQNEANAKANALYTSNKEGTDKYDKSEIGYEMYVKIDDKQKMSVLSPSASKDIPNYEKYLVRINKFSLYIAEDAAGYRGIVNSLPLNTLRRSGENIGAGQCCKAVSPVSKEEVLIGTSSMGLYCFSVESEDDSWYLCHEDKAQASFPFNSDKARGEVMMGIIKNYLFEIGQLGDMSLVSISGVNIFDNWTWNNQEDWPGICKEGQFQSPINFVDGQTTLAPNMRLLWKLASEEVPIANYNGHQVVVTGAFGNLVHQLEIGERTFSFKTLTFKFPSEHQFNGVTLDGEILAIGQSKDGLKSIVSFMVKEVVDGDADHNKFVEALDVEGWKKDPKEKYRLDGRPDLSDIVKGGAFVYYQKSFYWYMGSESEPPCSQEVFRFVFKEAVEVPSVQFQAWKNAAYNSEEETRGNSRKAKDMSGRLVYYHVDKSANCKLPAEKIMEAANDEIAKREAERPKEWRGKFLIANTTLNSYAATYDHDWTHVENDWMSIDPVEKGLVPADSLKQLETKEIERKKYWAEKTMTKSGINIKNTKIVY